MARGNIPILAFNRGLIDRKALARTDLDRTRLSAEVMTNWLPSTQGSMRIRPGTKYCGHTFNDTGAQFIEFAASTTQTALLEIANDTGGTGVMRVWLPSDTGNTWETGPGGLVPMARPKVDTTLSLSDTGWEDDSVGGTATTGAVDIIPAMTDETTDGVKITANAHAPAYAPWKIADDDNVTRWYDDAAVPSWVNVDFGSAKTITSYSLRAGPVSGALDNMPSKWRLLGSDHDTGSYATDTGKWTLEDERSGFTSWSLSQRREFALSDTGTADAWRHWRLYIPTGSIPDPNNNDPIISELELMAVPSLFGSAGLTMNPGALGAHSIVRKRVIVDTGDVLKEHSLALDVGRGPITLRVGSTSGDDDYVRETSLAKGYHNIAFVPGDTGTGVSSDVEFHVTLQSSGMVNKIVRSVSIGDSGTVEVTTPWQADNLNDLRYDQSADVVFVDCDGVRPQRIERRGTGRSWSVVDYAPENGPFFVPGSSARMNVTQNYGNSTLQSDIPYFREGHVGALFRLTHNGQSGTWFLGNNDASTDVIEMTGYNDTGAGASQDTGAAATRERQIRFKISGTFVGKVTIQRSFDGPDIGFHDTDSTATSSTTLWLHDNDDNVTVWYRAIVKNGDYTSGAIRVDAYYFNGIRSGIGRVTGYNSNQSVDIEVLRSFADSGPAFLWEEGSWSDLRGYPQVPALHEGRLFHAGKANIWGSVSDDYENFDDEVEGEAAPIARTLGSGPVDNINFMISLIRLVLGTDGREISVRSSSLDEPLTVENSSAKAFSSLGSADLRAVNIDSRAVFVQRSGQRLYSVGFGTSAETFGDFESKELTLLVPSLMRAGVVSVAVQRQPDTRVHCVLANGKVAILTYEAQEDVLCWSMWETDGSVERAMVLPGANEDNVYYLIKRTVGGVDKRLLEQWASEAESECDTGLSWIADCAVSYTHDTGDGRTSTANGASPMVGESVIAWADDTGQDAGKDLSPGEWGSQTTYTVDGNGAINLGEDVHHCVYGLPYKADFKSTKLAYAAQMGTALGQMKRTAQIAFVLSNTHNNALFVGEDTGTGLHPLPRMIDRGVEVDSDKIFTEFDNIAFPMKGRWSTDSRIFLRAVAPRAATVMALVPSIDTNER